MALVKAYRMHGHLAARLDPLGSEPVGDPALDPTRLIPRLTPELQARIPASVLRINVPGETLAEALPRLEETYCGTMAYEIEHIAIHEQRVWLRQAIESWRFRKPLAAEEQRRLYTRLCQVEACERYLRRSFLGQKQFSLEGLDALIPMLDESLELAAAAGTREAVLGMAHRGRLNVLAHTVGMPYEQILREFEGERTLDVVAADVEGGTGRREVPPRRARRLPGRGRRDRRHRRCEPEPPRGRRPGRRGHGRARADGPQRRLRLARPERRDPDPACTATPPSRARASSRRRSTYYALEGYWTGGTLHLITNNQVGFTTDPEQGRSTRYSSDLAKGFDVPIVHVNADDPEAAISAVRLALAYRRRFGHDVVIDLVGYRRFGHNEQDEAAYTQPLMVELIERHPTVRELYGAKLVEAGVLTADEAESLAAEALERLREAHERLKASFGEEVPPKSRSERVPREGSEPIATAVPADVLRALNEQLLARARGLHGAPEARAPARAPPRRTRQRGEIDWGQAEALAFASLLLDGVPVRLTGQDTERGTFSHRHLVLHDAANGERWTPIQELDEAKASFEVYNSPLSEFACVGFEYGYSAAAPETLVLWEAQFGDFANGAQTIIDQFISSGLAKWRQTSRLTLLLPHGYEGNGPEHSSARLERFLQLAAQENIRIANCTTAAQYFHLLRRQALDPSARPLVVMTPKGLLRLKDAASTLRDLTDGRFQPAARRAGAARRRPFAASCSAPARSTTTSSATSSRTTDECVAVARIEQLYPFPVDAARELIASYPHLDEVVWAQEEPQNMGAWRTIRHRLEEAAAGRPVRYVGRPWRASTAEGYPTAHLLEQDRIVRAALER